MKINFIKYLQSSSARLALRESLVGRLLVLSGFSFLIVAILTPFRIIDAEEFCLQQSAYGQNFYLGGLGRPAHFAVLKLISFVTSNELLLGKIYASLAMFGICLAIGIIAEIVYRETKNLQLAMIFVLFSSANSITINFAYSLYSDAFAFLFLALAAYATTQSRTIIYSLISVLFKEAFFIFAISIFIYKKIRVRLKLALIGFMALAFPVLAYCYIYDSHMFKFLATQFSTQLNFDFWAESQILKWQNIKNEVWPVLAVQIMLCLYAFAIANRQQRNSFKLFAFANLILFLLLPYGAESDFRNHFGLSILSSICAIYILTNTSQAKKKFGYLLLALHFIGLGLTGFNHGRFDKKKEARINQVIQYSKLGTLMEPTILLEPELAYSCLLRANLNSKQQSAILQIPKDNSQIDDFILSIDSKLHAGARVLFLDLGTKTKSRLEQSFMLIPIEQKIFELKNQIHN